MAPVLWLPLFVIMMYMFFWTKSIVYFSNNPLLTQLKSNLTSQKSTNWLW